MMSGSIDTPQKDDFKKAKDLKVVVKFEIDNGPDRISRSRQAKMIICEMILLGKKRGRPSQLEENLDAAA